MPKRKRRTKKQPEPAPEPEKEVFQAKRKRRKPRKKLEPMATASPDNAPKTLMQRIFESQRAELERLSEDIRKVIFLGW
jgi:hypothetical protein